MDAVRRWLRQNDMTGAELGKRVGVSKASVCLWLSGKRTPRAATARKLAKVTGLSLDAIYTHSTRRAA